MIRRPPIETKINHERWLVSYADFITLLFAFFVVMYSVSHVNEKKYRQLSATLKGAFSTESEKQQEASQAENQNSSNVADIESLADDIQSALAGVVDDADVNISGNEQWVEISLDANLLFATAQAELADEAKTLLTPVAEILAPYDNAVAIAGHTDDVPISNAQFQSNWALSSARAVSVVKFLATQNVAPARLSAVGYGEYRPVVPNTDADSRARNRRVVIRVARDAVPAAKVSPTQFESQEGQPTATPAPDALATPLPNDASARELTPTPERAPVPESTPPVAPVRLRGGGILFSRDPDLPRTNPPVSSPASPPTSPPASPGSGQGETNTVPEA